MDKLKTICIFALFCFALSLLPAIAADEKERPDFSGNWRLNTFISDHPLEKMNQAAAEMMRSERISERDSRRMDYGLISPGSMALRERDPRAEKEKIEITYPGFDLSAESIEITHEEPELTIRYHGAREVTVITDGRVEKREWGFGPIETRARWKKKDKLVIRTTNNAGRITTKKYELVLGGKQLKVATHIEDMRPAPSFKFTSYYDLMPSEGTETED
jgi:hypothetical protein